MNVWKSALFPFAVPLCLLVGCTESVTDVSDCGVAGATGNASGYTGGNPGKTLASGGAGGKSGSAANKAEGTGGKTSAGNGGASAGGAAASSAGVGGAGVGGAGVGGASGRAGASGKSGASGGSSGRSGNGGAGAGGNGGQGGATGTGTLLGDPVACAACEEADPTSDYTCSGLRSQCLNAEGNAAQGLKTGAPKSELCQDVLSCIWRTGCATTQPGGVPQPLKDCVCGAGIDCFPPSAIPAQGKCKEELLAAAEVTDDSDIQSGKFQNRTDDQRLAAGLAMQLIYCDQYTCPLECAICMPAPGSGPDGDSTCQPRTCPPESSCYVPPTTAEDAGI